MTENDKLTFRYPPRPGPIKINFVIFLYFNPTGSYHIVSIFNMQISELR